MNSGHILRAVAKHYDWRSGRLIPEAAVRVVTKDFYEGWHGERPIIRDYLADLMYVTPSDYATEIEIKVSMQDWRADLSKFKWGCMPPWITRFVYAVPANFGIPDFVPAEAGVLHVTRISGTSDLRVRVARPPKKFGSEKVPKQVLDKWLSNLYYRYWHQRLHKDNRLPVLQKRVFLKPLEQRKKWGKWNE